MIGDSPFSCRMAARVASSRTAHFRIQPRRPVILVDLPLVDRPRRRGGGQGALALFRQQLEEVALGLEVRGQVSVGGALSILRREVSLPHGLEEVAVVDVDEATAVQEIGPELAQDGKEVSRLVLPVPEQALQLSLGKVPPLCQ